MQRLINIFLVLTFAVCYLEWANKSSFIFQAEYSLFFEKNDPLNSFKHPLILLPFIGQLFLLYTAIQKRPNKKIAIIGQILLSLLVLLILLVGILVANIKIILSTIPFLICSLFFYTRLKKYKLTS